MIDNLITIYLPDREIKFREASFNDYKSICKMLVSDIPEDIEKCINTVLKELVQESTDNLNIVEKFISFITIRNTILGNELDINVNDIKTTLNLNSLLSRDFMDNPITYGDIVFKSPSNFINNKVDTFIAECVVSMYGRDVRDLSINKRLELINQTDISITEVYKILNEEFAKRIIDITKDIKLSIYAQNKTLKFMRNLIVEDLFNLLSFEYTCLKNLNLNSTDFRNYTYPELKIFLNHLIKDNKEEQNRHEQPIA